MRSFPYSQSLLKYSARYSWKDCTFTMVKYLVPVCIFSAILFTAAQSTAIPPRTSSSVECSLHDGALIDIGPSDSAAAVVSERFEEACESSQSEIVTRISNDLVVFFCPLARGATCTNSGYQDAMRRIRLECVDESNPASYYVRAAHSFRNMPQFSDRGCGM